MSTETKFQMYVIALGAVGLDKGKLYYGFQPCTPNGVPTGQERACFSKKYSFTTAGVYAMEADLIDGEISTIYPNSFKYMGLVTDDDQAATIKLQAEAVTTEHTARQQAKKALNDKTVILETLKPLRKAYAKTNAVGRLALELRILNYLRNGKDL